MGDFRVLRGGPKGMTAFLCNGLPGSFEKNSGAPESRFMRSRKTGREFWIWCNTNPGVGGQ